MTDTTNLNQVVPQGAGGGGGKGGGGGGQTPTETPDSLQSVAFVSVLDLLCEGEIQGLVNGMQSIFLNGVPLLQSDGATPNFSGATVGWTDGTQTQSYIPGFGGVEATVTLGTQVFAAVPVTTAIDNVSANAVVVTLAVGALSSTSNTTGDISGTSVEMVVDYQPQNSGWIRAIDATFTGKSSSRYERSYRFPLTGTGPWNVRVSRVTPDSTSDLLANTTYVDAVSSIVDQQLRYPNSALVGMQIDARQFSSIPTRTYLVQGLKIKVPRNYNPLTRIYTGIWDGSFQVAYSNNPAWCLYDLLTSERYGLGNYINTSQIDTVGLYEIGQYCDELVPDGFGGQEPRFQLNVCLNTAKDAYDMIQDICSVFRGMTYWSVGSVIVTQDAPQAPTAIFSPSNVVSGAFNYVGSARKDRHTVALVQWNDPNQQYVQATEYVEDPDGITRYGVRSVQIMAVGTTTRGQAYRLGKWMLLSERLDTDQLTFQTGLEGAQLVPGQIIQVADPTRAARRMGGRVIAGTLNSIQLDAPVTFDSGQSYTLYFIDSTGTQQSVGVVNSNNTTASLSFTTTAPAAPNPGFMWVLASTDLEPQLFRVINVTESALNTFDVMAISYNESKFNGVDFNTALQLPPIGLGAGLGATTPTNWSVTPATYLSAPGVLGQKLVLSWSGNTTQFQLQYQANSGVWVTVQMHTPTYEILGVTAGDVYSFRVFGVSADGSLSSSLDEVYTVPAKSVAPGAPTSLTAQGGIHTVVLNWAAPSDLDLDYFQVFMASSNILANATIVGDKIGSTTWTVGNLVSGDTYYFWVRAVNTSGVVGPYDSNTGTAGTPLFVQPGDFSLGSILNAISTAGDINGALIANATITQANIAAQAVGTVQIQDAAIATNKIATGAVTATQIANAAIGTAQIANAAIATALIQTAAVGTAQIQNAAVTSALIANAAVGTAQIQDAGITSAKIGTAQINTAHIGTAQIDTLRIAGNAVTTMAVWTSSGAPSGNYTSRGGPATVVFGGFSTNTQNSSAGITLQVDGTNYATVSGESGSSTGGTSLTSVWGGTLPPGSHTLSLVSGTSLSSGVITILEALR